MCHFLRYIKGSDLVAACVLVTLKFCEHEDPINYRLSLNMGQNKEEQEIKNQPA